MIWVPIAAWAGAVLFAVVVLGFCAYEIVWKARRLQSDLIRLHQTQTDAMSLRDALQSSVERLNRATGAR